MIRTRQQQGRITPLTTDQYEARAEIAALWDAVAAVKRRRGDTIGAEAAERTSRLYWEATARHEQRVRVQQAV